LIRRTIINHNEIRHKGKGVFDNLLTESFNIITRDQSTDSSNFQRFPPYY